MNDHTDQRRPGPGPAAVPSSGDEQAAMTQTAIVAVLRDEVYPLSTREITQRITASKVGALACNWIRAALNDLYHQGVLGRAKAGHDVCWELSEQYWDRLDESGAAAAELGVGERAVLNALAHQSNTTSTSVAALFRRC